jgi:hypothetical protein
VGIYVAAALQRRVILTEHRPPLAAALSSVAYHVDGTLDYGLLEGSDVPKTDVLLNLLHKNKKQNLHLFRSAGEDTNGNSLDIASCVPQVEELDWTVPNHVDEILDKYKSPNGFPLLFASDVTYVTSLHAPLASTIARLLSKKNSPTTKSASKCWIAHQQRGVANLLGEDVQLKSFLTALEKEGLKATIQQAPAAVDDELVKEQDALIEPSHGTKLLNGPVKLLHICHATNEKSRDKDSGL